MFSIIGHIDICLALVKMSTHFSLSSLKIVMTTLGRPLLVPE